MYEDVNAYKKGTIPTVIRSGDVELNTSVALLFAVHDFNQHWVCHKKKRPLKSVPVGQDLK